MNPQPLIRASSNPCLDDPIDHPHDHLDLGNGSGSTGCRDINRWVKGDPEPRATKPFNSGREQYRAMMYHELSRRRRGHGILAEKSITPSPFGSSGSLR